MDRKILFVLTTFFSCSSEEYKDAHVYEKIAGIQKDVQELGDTSSEISVLRKEVTTLSLLTKNQQEREKEALYAKNAELEKNNEALQLQLSQIQGKLLEALEQWKDEPSHEDISSLKTQVQELQKVQTNQIEGIENNLKNKIEELKSGQQPTQPVQQIPQFDPKSLETLITNLSNKLSQEQAGINGKFDDLGFRLSELQTKMQEVLKLGEIPNLSEVQKKNEELSATLKSVQEEQQRSFEEFSKLQKDEFASIEKSLKNFEQQLSKLQTSFQTKNEEMIQEQEVKEEVPPPNEPPKNPEPQNVISPEEFYKNTVKKVEVKVEESRWNFLRKSKRGSILCASLKRSLSGKEKETISSRENKYAEVLLERSGSQIELGDIRRIDLDDGDSVTSIFPNFAPLLFDVIELKISGNSFFGGPYNLTVSKKKSNHNLNDAYEVLLKSASKFGYDTVLTDSILNFEEKKKIFFSEVSEDEFLKIILQGMPKEEMFNAILWGANKDTTWGQYSKESINEILFHCENKTEIVLWDKKCLTLGS